MRKRFIIVNNGLRDHRGHYFETSMSVAEAARRAGWRPVLATHVDCRPDLLPDWLEAHPLFRTDHWMDQPPADPAMAQVEAPYLPESQLPQVLRRAWRNCRRFAWAADRCGFYCLPPFIYDGARGLARWCVPRILRRQYRTAVGARLVHVARQLHWIEQDPWQLGAGFPNLKRALREPDRARLVNEALAELSREQAHEIEYGLIFFDDLRRLLTLAGAGAEDHVWLGTAHAREVLAVCLAVQRLGARSPTFHLEFRHSLYRSEPTRQEWEQSPMVRLYRIFFSLHERAGCSERIKFYTDTAELARDYESLARQPFGVLPIPFRGELISPIGRRPGEPLRLAYLGEARDEKGFPLLPGLMDGLYEEYLRSGRVRLLVQANVSAPQYNPRSAASLDRLKRYPAHYVELFGLDAPLSPEDYYSLVSQADAVLLPYDRDRYRACSSGTLAEALAGGRPAVVPARSWMSAQLPPGGGEVFHDAASLLDAVSRVIEHYDEYRRCAETHAPSWRSAHSPDALVAALVRPAPVKALPPQSLAA